jgi:hypothetical protein
VAHVKKTNRLSHRAVLLEDSSVLNRHIPAAKIHKAGAVGVVKRV